MLSLFDSWLFDVFNTFTCSLRDCLCPRELFIFKVKNTKKGGYQIFHGSPNELILPPFVNSAVDYKPEQFEMVHAITEATIVVLVRNGLEVEDVDELLELAQQAEHSLTYGTVGTGSLYHLIGEKISQDIDTPLEHIAYRGAAPAIK